MTAPGWTLASAFAKASVTLRTGQGMTCQIQVLRGSLGTLDPTTGLVGGLTGASTVYSGPARIRTVSGGSTINLGGGEIAVRDTIISIPMSAAVPRRDDLISVVSGDDDTDLDTRIFRVLGADGGGLFGDARRMSCAGWYQSRYWGTG